jgi:uncharacterized membrane protein
MNKPAPDWGQLAMLLGLLIAVGATITGAIAAAVSDTYGVDDYISDLGVLVLGVAALLYAWHHRRPTVDAGTVYQRDPHVVP